jgi:dsDNA-specific endonuclease/ATPase MutS2
MTNVNIDSGAINGTNITVGFNKTLVVSNGCLVTIAAQKLVILQKPYQSIYSRIIGHDNLFKELSTYAVEISELRTILNTANENSLVLGDDLCSGEAHISRQRSEKRTGHCK